MRPSPLDSQLPGNSDIRPLSQTDADSDLVGDVCDTNEDR